MFRKLTAIFIVAGMLMVWIETGRSSPIVVPNASLESPATPFVSINIDFWQKALKGASFAGTDEGWGQLTGIFKNTPVTSSDYIHNCDGNQALWLFAVPEVALFQDYNSVDWNDPAPTHAFDSRFEVGKSYQLTVGVIGGGGAMLEGVSLELSLYYRDAASNKVAVAATAITNNLTNFPDKTNFVAFRVDVPTVRTGDAWAGQNIGIQFLSTVTTNLQGGYWDLDNIRLTSQVEPVLRNSVQTNGQFSFTLLSEPGSQFDILTTTNVALATSNWTSVVTLTNDTGTMSFTNPVINPGPRFYRALQRP